MAEEPTPTPTNQRAVIPRPRRRPNLRWPNPPPTDPLRYPGQIDIAWRFHFNGAWLTDQYGDAMSTDLSGLDLETATAVLEEMVELAAERFRQTLREQALRQLEAARAHTRVPQPQPNPLTTTAITLEELNELRDRMLATPPGGVMLTRRTPPMAEQLTTVRRATEDLFRNVRLNMEDLLPRGVVGMWLDEPRIPRRPRPTTLADAFKENKDG